MPPRDSLTDPAWRAGLTPSQRNHLATEDITSSADLVTLDPEFRATTWRTVPTIPDWLKAALPEVPPTVMAPPNLSREDKSGTCNPREQPSAPPDPPSPFKISPPQRTGHPKQYRSTAGPWRLSKLAKATASPSPTTSAYSLGPWPTTFLQDKKSADFK